MKRSVGIRPVLRAGTAARRGWPSGLETLTGVLLGAVVAGLPGTRAGAAEILEVLPARADSVLVCTILTTGLPDARVRETLSSGLPSSMVIGLTLLDEAGRDLCAIRADIRIEPDLLEGTLSVLSPTGERRVRSLSDLGALLSSLGPIPLAPMTETRSGSIHRIEARIAVHPLAPAVSHQVRSLVAEPEDGARREFAVGLGTLLRYLLRRGDDEPWSTRAISAPFRPNALPDWSAAVDDTVSPGRNPHRTEGGQ